ncbi:hypothetical protein Dimus_003084, partial [Dionaea muscipula]
MEQTLKKKMKQTFEAMEGNFSSVQSLQSFMGLRLSLPHLVIRLLNRHDLLLAQLTLNAISYILSFIILCEDKAVEASSCLFDTVFSLVEEPKASFKLVQDLPETPVIWKRKFITVQSRDWPQEHFTLYRYATPWVRVNKFNLWNRNEKRALDSFSAARPNFPLCHEVVNLESLEENMLTSYPHPRKMSAQCFLLYGMTGSKQRLAAMRRLRKKTSTKQEVETQRAL